MSLNAEITKAVDQRIRPKSELSQLHTFVIGDIHGRADLLSVMLDGIASMAASRGYSYRIVFLGDIIDRGRESAAAMELVWKVLQDDPNSVLILGNHDHFVLRIMDEPDLDRREISLDHWLFRLGGDDTVHSYGFDPDSFTLKDLELLPSRHIEMLRQAKHYVEMETHILVHAGIRPGIPLEEQAPHDLMWIRNGFLDHLDGFAKTIVHGHTPTACCEVCNDRINIDTHAYASGRLSVLHLAPGGVEAFFEATVEGFQSSRPSSETTMSLSA